MIIVTGGAGFIGSNLVWQLNQMGRKDVLIVDNLENTVKFKNMLALKCQDYLDKRAFMAAIEAGKFDNTQIDAFFHEGADGLRLFTGEGKGGRCEHGSACGNKSSSHG